ncbi:hypothetical protein C8J57DRAFT_1255915 [Mycena rebaudengoi]|nr:hypothetical protein C8J57DRAFT_1255915 [Mycena rebaudengoi]
MKSNCIKEIFGVRRASSSFLLVYCPEKLSRSFALRIRPPRSVLELTCFFCALFDGCTPHLRCLMHCRQFSQCATHPSFDPARRSGAGPTYVVISPIRNTGPTLRTGRMPQWGTDGTCDFSLVSLITLRLLPRLGTDVMTRCVNVGLRNSKGADQNFPDGGDPIWDGDPKKAPLICPSFDGFAVVLNRFWCCSGKVELWEIKWKLCGCSRLASDGSEVGTPGTADTPAEA